ncbi:MAG TPA: glucosyl-3-phosphoglycerate synthase [Acidimicrobiales bacterium]|nr:glucosyl-3-phosphoglycerate synthase [Acidimicrobiales bacterium]
MRRSYRSVDFTAARLVAAKRGRRISVCIPARDEEATVGPIVQAIRRDLMEAAPVVDQILVVDDGSLDSTAAVAAAAGAEVLRSDEVLTEHSGPGKGQAMWKAVHACSGDLVVFCDADIRDFDPGFVLGLAGPLATRDDVTFVKGFYERPVDGRPGEGGRVTELMARPLISVLFPHLADLTQPLSGECAARREVLEALPFVGGYGVDLGLLIDVTERFGDAGLVQCDLGVRIHRNRPLSDLGPQALAILEAGLARAGLAGAAMAATLMRPGVEPVSVRLEEMPPLAEVPAHRKTA